MRKSRGGFLLQGGGFLFITPPPQIGIAEPPFTGQKKWDLFHIKEKCRLYQKHILLFLGKKETSTFLVQIRSVVKILLKRTSWLTERKHKLYSIFFTETLTNAGKEKKKKGTYD